MDRPILTPQTPIDDFRSFYWLKEELLAFCRANGLSTAGSKMDLARRIEAFFSTGADSPPAPKAPVSKTKQPPAAELRRDTVIGPGWRCSQDLRAFFEREIGPRFHFDGVMRDFIKCGSGKTLQEAIDAWEVGQGQPGAAKDIAPQFEYNRHIRKYFGDHPGASLQEAIAAWNEQKAQRRATIT